MKLFDARAALAEIENQRPTPASSASSASLSPVLPPQEAKEAEEAASGVQIRKPAIFRAAAPFQAFEVSFAGQNGLMQARLLLTQH